MRRTYIVAEIRDAERGFIRQLAPAKSQCALRFNTPSTAYLTVKDSHPVVAQVLEEGVRAAVWMISIDGNSLTKKRLLEGPIGDVSGEGPFGTVTIPVIDDLAWLRYILGWPKPGAALNAQTDEYARYTGTSETRALAALAANVTRLGLPLNVPASAGRGTTGTTELRMHALADKILSPLTADRLQMAVERNATTDQWDVAIRAGDVYARPLTPQSGVLGRWKWRRQRTGATRVIVGGAGQGVDREFARLIDAAREVQLDRILEVFDDSRMAAAGADLTPYGNATLAETAPKAGLEATLRETSWFRFDAGSYDLGTVLPFQIGALQVEDVVTQIDITHDVASGFSASPKVGFVTTDPEERLVDFVTGLASSVRSLERR